MRWDIWINAENNRSFDPNGEARSRLAAMFVVPRLPRDFGTYAIWFTLSRAACEPIELPLNSSNIQADFTSDRVWISSDYFESLLLPQ